MIEIKEFRKRYQVFEKIDSKNDPHTYQKFWKYKLEIENETNHILDKNYKETTLSKLKPILKICQWNRPYDFDYCFGILENAVDENSESYNCIRFFDLTQFDELPEKHLKMIWYAFGSIADSFEGQLAMKITKPLMFLWGQTPAFDSLVRTRMPLFTIPGFTNTRWNFNLWIEVMKTLQNYLYTHSDLVIAFKEISKKKYGQNKILPYGQFFDLYYWTEDKLKNKKVNKRPSLDAQISIALEKKAKQKEYQNLTNLLNKLRSIGKISSEERRDFADRWRNNPGLGDSIIRQLERMLDQKI